MDEYIPIKEIKNGMFIPIEEFAGMLEVTFVSEKDNALILELRWYDETLYDGVVYPLSKEMDKKTKVSTSRFMTFLEWQIMKKIDTIFEINNRFFDGEIDEDFEF